MILSSDFLCLIYFFFSIFFSLNYFGTFFFDCSTLLFISPCCRKFDYHLPGISSRRCLVVAIAFSQLSLVPRAPFPSPATGYEQVVVCIHWGGALQYERYAFHPRTHKIRFHRKKTDMSIQLKNTENMFFKEISPHSCPPIQIKTNGNKLWSWR